MNKTEFTQEVNALLKRARQISFDDPAGAMKVAEDFEEFVVSHQPYVNIYATEHIGIIKAEFSRMRSAKHKDKIDGWRKGCFDLERDIESMLFDNSYPDD